VKILSRTLIFLFVITGAQAQQNRQPGPQFKLPEDFPTAKKVSLTIVERQLDNLQKVRTCIVAAEKNEELVTCRELAMKNRNEIQEKIMQAQRNQFNKRMKEFEENKAKGSPAKK